MTKNEAKNRKVPFWLNGKFLDWETGQEYFDHRKFAGPYEGYCFVGQELFYTFWQNNERGWQVV